MDEKFPDSFVSWTFWLLCCLPVRFVPNLPAGGTSTKRSLCSFVPALVVCAAPPGGRFESFDLKSGRGRVSHNKSSRDVCFCVGVSDARLTQRSHSHSFAWPLTFYLLPEVELTPLGGFADDLWPFPGFPTHIWMNSSSSKDVLTDDRFPVKIRAGRDVMCRRAEFLLGLPVRYLSRGASQVLLLLITPPVSVFSGWIMMGVKRGAVGPKPPTLHPLPASLLTDQPRSFGIWSDQAANGEHLHVKVSAGGRWHTQMKRGSCRPSHNNADN